MSTHVHDGRRSLSKRSRAAVKAALQLGLIVGCAQAALSSSAHAASNDPVVTTQEGRVKGFLKNGVAEFLGIPFAEPPVGNLRWRPPHNKEPWTNVLKATAFGPTCAQITTLGAFAGPANANEDCLYLNVFTPDVDPAGKEKLPVIFWIYGGGNVDGESNDYDASKLASQGHTVVVTINYRMGLMGFLAHPALDKEGHPFANYGILDQQAALRWVKRNIARFGGDKNNVTVGGQSAGASNAAANLISPLAAGLFERAILESGISYFASLTPLDVAETRGTNFAVAAGCGSGATAAVAKCLRGLSAEKVLSLQGTASANGPYVLYMALDGQILPRSFTSAFSSGQFNKMPVMNGTVQDEGNFNIGITEYFSGPPRKPISAEDYTNAVTTTYSGNAGPGGSPPTYPAGTVQAVLAQYPLSAYATPQLALDAVTTDTSVCRSRHASQLLKDQVPVYAYEFQDRTAPYYFPKMPGFQPLAAHTIDIQFLFPLYHGGPDGIPHELNAKQENLSDQLVAAWTNFAWTGNPNGQGNSPWPQYKGSNPLMLVENVPALSTITDAQFSTEHKCDFWKNILINN